MRETKWKRRQWWTLMRPLTNFIGAKNDGAVLVGENIAFALSQTTGGPWLCLDPCLWQQLLLWRFFGCRSAHYGQIDVGETPDCAVAFVGVDCHGHLGHQVVVGNCMPRGIFIDICTKLGPTIQQWIMVAQVLSSVEKCIATAIWKLTTPDSLWSIVNHFGISKPTAGEAVRVYLAIQRVMASNIICLADPQKVVDRFASLSFPTV